MTVEAIEQAAVRRARAEARRLEHAAERLETIVAEIEKCEHLAREATAKAQRLRHERRVLLRDVGASAKAPRGVTTTIVLEQLKDGQAWSAVTLASAVAVDQNAVRQCLTRLYKLGRVERTARGRYRIVREEAA